MPDNFSQHSEFDNEFNPDKLARSVISLPLLDWMSDPERGVMPIVIDTNLAFPKGREAARGWIIAALRKINPESLHAAKNEFSEQYVFASLGAEQIREIVGVDRRAHGKDIAIRRIWPDFPIKGFITKSIATVKADAARNAFSALGADITWAVMDSGIDETHPHFRANRNLELPSDAVGHRDFTIIGKDTPPTEAVAIRTDPSALVDKKGHGTHVAGIIAGELRSSSSGEIIAVSRQRNETDGFEISTDEMEFISGMAPKCRLVSLKVLDDNGNGAVSNLLAAISYIQKVNSYGRFLVIQGVNISLGYDFEPEWFACGQSPLCVEVDRLVASGVVVVVAAGNTGYGSVQTKFSGVRPAGLGLTINDPGNAAEAITVGSTHRDMPHVYGVSYFSSKGPTGDGRLKPDLVAPGERIISCATGALKEDAGAGTPCNYVETSGTSMAAPHVSGVIAAFLSVRREFIGRPRDVKELFVSTATDLKRDRYFQGSGLVDLMRAIQAI